MGHFIMMRDAKTIGKLKEKNEKFYTAKFFTCGDNPDRRYPFDFEYRAREIGESGKSLNDVIRWSECDIVLRDDTPILGYQLVDRELAFTKYSIDFREEWDFDDDEEYDDIEVMLVMLPDNYEQFRK